MIAFVRILMQVLFARAMAYGPIGALVAWAVETFGLTHDQIIDTATVVSLGLLVGASKGLQRTPLAKVVEWWNLILSWGQSRGGPEYVGKHVQPGDDEAVVVMIPGDDDEPPPV